MAQRSPHQRIGIGPVDGEGSLKALRHGRLHECHSTRCHIRWQWPTAAAAAAAACPLSCCCRHIQLSCVHQDIPQCIVGCWVSTSKLRCCAQLLCRLLQQGLSQRGVLGMLAYAVQPHTPVMQQPGQIITSRRVAEPTAAAVGAQGSVKRCLPCCRIPSSQNSLTKRNLGIRQIGQCLL